MTLLPFDLELFLKALNAHEQDIRAQMARIRESSLGDGGYILYLEGQLKGIAFARQQAQKNSLLP